MEGCCLYRFIEQGNESSFYDNGGGDVHKSNDTVREFYLHLSYSKLKNSATTTAHSHTLLAKVFEKKQMIRGPHQVTSVLGLIVPNDLALIPTVKYRMNSLTTIVPYPWKVAV